MPDTWLRLSVFGALFGSLWLVAVGLIAQGAPQQTETIYDLRNAGENGITSPQAVYHPEPEYTDRARKRKIRGHGSSFHDRHTARRRTRAENHAEPG
jgi:hypothetical protein